jgi:hypothetical protein
VVQRCVLGCDVRRTVGRAVVQEDDRIPVEPLPDEGVERLPDERTPVVQGHADDGAD